MGRRSHGRALEVWANGLRVGRWSIPASGPMELVYDASWVRAEEARPLSLSLPMNLDGIPLKGKEVGFFFDNLLPDSDAIRERVRARFRTVSASAFDLLSAIGRDCVGALQLLPEGDVPEGIDKISVTPLDDEAVERKLLRVTVPTSRLIEEDDDDFRISIAGAQEKTALTLHKGRWCAPHGSTPSTHIFKLPLGFVGESYDMRASLENEWLCSRLLAAYGVPVAPCEVKQFGKTKVLIVSRFDRKLHSSKRYWLRLPQEDFCQATGTPSSMKYEADGGPGLQAISRVLQGSETRDDDLATLFRAQLLFWMLAAVDGHAKNFSIQLLPKGRFRLTPLYDVLSVWPIAGSRHGQVHAKRMKLAMAVSGANKHYRIVEIQRRHFNEMARRCGLGHDMEAIVTDVLAKTPGVIDSVAAALPHGFPASVFESVTAGLRKAAADLEQMPPK